MSQAGLDAIRTNVAVSPITVWALTRTAAMGKLPPLPAEQGSFSRHLTALGFRDAPLLLEVTEAAKSLPPHHHDPMDRMLITTALRADLTVITNDALYPLYAVKAVW